MKLLNIICLFILVSLIPLSSADVLAYWDFDDGTENFTVVSGKDAMEISTLHNVSSPYSFMKNSTGSQAEYVVLDITAQNYTVTSEVYDENVTENIFIFAIKVNTTNYYMGVDTKGYGLTHSDTKYSHKINSTTYPASLSRSLGWRSFKYTINGTHISGYIDDTLIFSNADTNLNLVKIILGSFWDGFDQTWYDNIKVESYVTTSPSILSYAPSTPNSSYANVDKPFNFTTDQTGNHTYWMNGNLVQTNTSVTTSTYTNLSVNNKGLFGLHNLTMKVENTNGTDTQKIDWTILENYVTTNITYDDRTNLSYNRIFDIITITPGVENISIGYGNTDSGNSYSLYFSNGTQIASTQIATSDNKTVWFNDTVAVYVVANDYFINETLGTASDTKFEYWTGSSWVEDEAQYYLWFTCFWWTPECDNEEQSDSQATLKITNNGTASGIPKMKLNESAPAGIKIYVDDDNTFAGAVELSNTYQAVSTSLSQDTNVTLWAWANLSGASAWDFETYAIVE